ncbi:MAG: hypothetical protein N2037_13120 [Acidimicrobiales bacterium]|nr:hypothetical protein [Acidimicrobiales bacterium]
MKAWRRIVLVVAIAGSLIAAACGRQRSIEIDSGGGPSPDSARPGEQAGVTNPEFALIVARAGEASCSDIESGRLTMAVDLNGTGRMGAGQPMLAMAFDRERERASVSVDLSGVFGARDDGSGIPSGGGVGVEDLVGTKAEVILDGDTAYVDWAFARAFWGVKTKWVKLTGDSSSSARGNPAPLGPDGCEPLQMLKGVGAEVAEVGTETLDGVATTHYRAVIDVAKAMEASSGEHRQRLTKFFEDIGDSDQIPVDLWVGEDGLVRKIVLAVEDYDRFVPEGAGGSSSGGSVPPARATITIEFRNLGEPVVIELPPANEVSEPAWALDSSEGGSGPAPGLGDR